MQTSTNELRREIKVKLTPPFDPSEADQFAALIIEHFFEVQSITQLLGQEINISSKIEGQIRRFCERLLKNEPIQYVLGYTEFYGRQFKTDARALIPRPETEELVDYILAQGVSAKSRIMDIGTGTGCIGITLALEAHCKVFAIDVDIDALNLARENAAALSAEISFIQADILTSKPGLGSLDIMVPGNHGPFGTGFRAINGPVHSRAKPTDLLPENRKSSCRISGAGRTTVPGNLPSCRPGSNVTVPGTPMVSGADKKRPAGKRPDA